MASMGLVLPALLLSSSCSLDLKIDRNALGSTNQIFFRPTIAPITVTEGSTVVFVLQLNAARSKATNVELSVSGPTNQLDRLTTAPVVIPIGETSATVSLNTLDDSVYQGVQQFTLTLRDADGEIPNSAIMTLTLQDNDPAPTITIADATAITESGQLSLTVTLTGATEVPAAVQYASANVTASAPDYTLAPGTLTFSPGTTSLMITADILADSLHEANETFEIKLSSATNSQIGDDTGVATITDDDAAPDLNWSAVSQTALESVTARSITAQLSFATGRDTTFLMTVAGTASASDHDLATQTVTIPAGQTSALINLTVTDDMLSEANETIVLTMSSNAGATLVAPSTHTITIEDNDGTFNIQGVGDAAGSTDVIYDAYLNLATSPRVSWDSYAPATSYDVTIFEDDGSTVKCAQQNTVLSQFSFTGCTLSDGLFYKAKVTAKSAMGLSLGDALNSPFRFRTNRAPTAVGEVMTVNISDSAVTIDARTSDTDPDVDTLTIIGKSNGTNGTVAITGGGTGVSYTPNGSFGGLDSFTYTIQDEGGLQSTATVQVRVMTPYTWTAAVSSNWSLGGNWCGIVSTPGLSGACSGASSAPSSSNDVRFDETCPACNAIINSTASAQRLTMASGYTGTITQASGVSLNVNGFYQYNGTFLGSDAAITVLAPGLHVQGGTFRSTSGVLALPRAGYNDGDDLFTVGSLATFQHNFGTLSISRGSAGSNYRTAYIDVPTNLNLYNLSFPSTGFYAGWYVALRTGDTLTIENDFLRGFMSLTSGTFDVKGNLIQPNDDATSSPNVIVRLSGAGAQTYSTTSTNPSRAFGRLVIDKASGTVSPAAGTTALTIGGLDVISGTFNAPTGTLKIDDDSEISKTIVSIGASPTATFNHSNGKVLIRAIGTCSMRWFFIDASPQWDLWDAEVQGNHGCGSGRSGIGPDTVGDKVVVHNDLTHTSGILTGAWEVHRNFNAVPVLGDYRLDTFPESRIATIKMTGTDNPNVTYTGINGEKTGVLEIDKPGGIVSPAAGTTDLALSGLKITQGSFIAPTGTLKLGIFSAGTRSVFDLLTGGSFTHSSGTVHFNSNMSFSCSPTYQTIRSDTGLVNFHHVSVDQPHNGCGNSNTRLRVEAGTTAVVQGNMSHTGGGIAGAWELQGSFHAQSGTSLMTSDNASLSFTGPSNVSITAGAGAVFPSGTVTINKPGQIVTIGSGVSFASSGQQFNVVAGDIQMAAGGAFSVRNLDLGGNTLAKNGGTLTVNGTVVGSGSLYNGTINP